jgi:integrase
MSMMMPDHPECSPNQSICLVANRFEKEITLRSELLVLEGRHLALSGDRPHIKVRQRVHRRRGEGLVIGPLKSRYSKRDVPISRALADRLSARGAAHHELVFRSTAGSILDPDNLATRVLAPACAAADVEWAGFHTFRHTVASRLFAEGRNVVQVQRWLGHHRRASRSTPTSTCSITISASRSRLPVLRQRRRGHFMAPREDERGGCPAG